jgi:hypothetical protein
VTNRALSGAWPTPEPAVLDLRVEGADARGLTDGDVRRLFPGPTTGERLNRLRNWPRIVVRIDDVPVGVATYTQTPIETQIPDFAVEIPHSFDVDHANVRRQVVDALLDAIQIASLEDRDALSSFRRAASRICFGTGTLPSLKVVAVRGWKNPCCKNEH